jgi:hypothetical protein
MSHSSKKGSAAGVLRSLTTETKFLVKGKGRQVHVLPRLVIQGIWFKNAGFEPGARVTVFVSNNFITIRPEIHGK